MADTQTTITIPVTMVTTTQDTTAVSQPSSSINATPLEDLNLQPSAISDRTHIDEVEEEEEEDEDDHDGDKQQTVSERPNEDTAYNPDLMALMQQIQGTTEPE